MATKKSPQTVDPALIIHPATHAETPAASADRHPLTAQQLQAPALNPYRPTAREIVRLQRVLGNQLVGRQLRQLVQRTLTRGSGWGWPTWTGGAAGQKLWEDINKNFNTGLPALKSQLNTLKEQNEFFADALQGVIDAIEKIELDYTAPIAYDGAKVLDGLLTGVIKQGADAVVELGVQKTARIEAAKVEIDKLLVRINALTSLKVSPIKPPTHEARRELKKKLEDLRTEERALPSSERRLLDKAVVAVEKSFRDSEAVALKAKQEKDTAELEQQKQQLLDEAEVLRIDTLKLAIQAKVGKNYANLLVKCGDVDTLGRFIPYVTLGDAGLLLNCLNFATPAELLKLLAVRPIPITTLNQLFLSLGAGRAASLLAMLKAISPGEEAQLLSVLTTTAGDAADQLKTLLTKADVATLATLLAQADTAKLTDLLVTKNRNIGHIKTLLASPSAADTVFLLEKMADTQFLVNLQPLAATPEEFRALVSDLPLNLPSIAAIKNLLKRKNTVTTMAEVKKEDEVKKARGLLTNAGVTIAVGTVSGLAGTAEPENVQATLDGIASGEFPTLTHSAGAKFGDAWNNDQGRLPGVRGMGGYKEYYVEKDPVSAGFHGERRLVVNTTTKHVYYTADHYASFMRIQ